MTKKKFEYMSTNEWLGDMTTHFMKSGEALRAPSTDQANLATHIPRVANGVKVEYDIAYDIPGKIHGYKYSDFLTKALYICPQSYLIARNNIAAFAKLETTREGRDVIYKLTAAMQDKYIQLGEFEDNFIIDELVILPGTNLLVKEDIVDMEKVDELVASGAYVKLHPITERTWANYLKQRWGSKVIPGDAPLYPLLRNCKKVWFTMSSESGIAATLLGKKIGLVNSKDKKAPSNFEHIYAGLDMAKNGSLLNKLTALMSHAGSGIITTYHDDPAGRIEAFFEHMSQFPHK